MKLLNISLLFFFVISICCNQFTIVESKISNSKPDNTNDSDSTKDSFLPPGIKIPEPILEEVNKYIDKFDSLDKSKRFPILAALGYVTEKLISRNFAFAGRISFLFFLGNEVYSFFQTINEREADKIWDFDIPFQDNFTVLIEHFINIVTGFVGSVGFVVQRIGHTLWTERKEEFIWMIIGASGGFFII